MKTITTVLIVAMIAACGREGREYGQYDVLKDSAEAKTCQQEGGELAFAMGSQFCSFTGYVCLMPGDKVPCNRD